MTATARLADAPFDRDNGWKSIDWKAAQRSVRRLQVRIAKAVKDKKLRKAKALQWLLVRSYHAKLLAIKRVTSNKGRRTPGVDGVIWSTPRQKMGATKLMRRRGYRPLPLRRMYIPKKNRKRKRPLSIPAMIDRALQALYKLALEPVAETLADANSYGFRQYRRCADAIAQCFNSLVRKYSPVWILEADIKACFDEINHSWLLEHIIMDKQTLRKWLEVGYMEGGKLYPTYNGTPQGGVISPMLANLTLDGLEAAVKASVPPRNKVNVIRYADDFVITAKSKELLEDKIVPAIELFLSQRGLRLSKAKTCIRRIDDGFDFLGQNIRKYKGKLLTKPAKGNVNSFLRHVRQVIRRYRGNKTVGMIGELNRIIRGWANYHRHVVSGKTFSYVDKCIYNALWRWIKRRHRNKSKTWMKKKYWLNGSKPWNFSTTVKDKKGHSGLYELFKASSISIVRHVKIKGDANPFDPEYKEYFRNRRACKKLWPNSVPDMRSTAVASHVAQM